MIFLANCLKKGLLIEMDREREKERERMFYYIFICSMRVIGIRESIKFINA